MTLVCECGGTLEITAQSYGDDGSAFEAYECVACGRTGTMTFNPTTGERKSGCVEVS